MTRAHAPIVALALILLSTNAIAQTPQAPLPTTQDVNQAMMRVEQDCASGKLNKLQCAYYAQVYDAMLRWVRVIESGAYQKLSPDVQQTIVAFAAATRSVPALMAALAAGQTNDDALRASRAALERVSAGAVRIREKCAKEWPTDFTMRAHCEGQQKEAGQKLSQRTMTAGDNLIIRQQCLKQWEDDLVMQNHCEEQQLEALKKLGR